MPWDAGRVPQSLEQFVARHSGRGRVLVPGCGTGYEVRLLAEAGFEVTAIDFSEEAIEAGRRALGSHAHLLRLADFFRFEGDQPHFDAIYERAFLCALPRRIWGDWATRTAALLRPGGLLFGLFYFDNNAKGPPFGIGAAELDALLSPSFDLVENEAVSDSIPAFAGRERWQVWRRRDNGR
ncbi:MAG: methyltransferase domain-containing protein [Betaproteobacteria bacterium]|nr:methyltransferase domain-containing protein [Betaproteobacteria bacterium]